MSTQAIKQSHSLVVTTTPANDPSGEGEEKGSLVHLYIPGQQATTAKSDGFINGENNSTPNSSRWTDTETKILLGLWKANYRLIKGKKRNFQEWNMIAKEFNRRVAHCSLGPRTGNQCKVRVKNLTAEYKRTKDQLPHSFPYHDLMKEILSEDKDILFEDDEIVHINIPSDIPSVGDGIIIPQTAMTVTGNHQTSTSLPTVANSAPRSLRPIAPAPTTPLNAPIPSQAEQLPITVQYYTQRPGNNASVTTATAVMSSATMATNHTRSFPTDEESSDDESFIEEPTMSTKRSYNALCDPTPRKKPRKNPRPVKMVQNYHEDVSLIAILREFLEDSRKREEELFNKILQQQLEAERRYQQFTLDVVKEIGKMFKKD